MNTKKTIDCLKGLIVDGVHQAQSGHPGGALSSLDFAYLLFTEHLRFDPDDPTWRGRDRFILSAGHESMLLYSLLFAKGWLTLSDLKAFRQLHSRTPGHPENTMTPGVECTTGPLGQGAAMSVGFAVASLHQEACFKSKLFFNRVWALLGDGCMQECVTLSAASLAGHLKLHNLIWYYDKNAQQISGAIGRATSDNEKLIFSGFGWNVLEVDGHNHDEIRDAINKAKNQSERPTLIVGYTTMAKGTASMEGMHKTHGAPLPADERLRSKKLWNIPEDSSFYWPEEAGKEFQRNFSSLREDIKAWKKELSQKLETDKKFSQQYYDYFDRKSFDLPAVSWDLTKKIATREAFGRLIEDYEKKLPSLIGGSADLEPSNMTEVYAKTVGDFGAQNRAGRNLAFGVREFAMSAITNGLALHGGLIPFDATFLSFADYSRPALRLGAIQKARVIHEFTHDSFYLGEDGPTHQPVEHLMSLRSMPGMYVMRPADPQETEVLFKRALTLKAPSSLCLTRQKLPYLNFSYAKIEEGTTKGAWIVRDDKDPAFVIFATGSEVSLALQVAEKIAKDFPSHLQKVRVVSVPCWELFFEQDESYRKEILLESCSRRISIEAGATLGWEKFVGAQGLKIGLDTFGESAPAEKLEKLYGFTAEAICEKITLNLL